MKKLTVLDIANILQLDNTVKEDLRNNFDSFDDDLKYNIQQVLWKGLDELKDRLAKLKYEQFMLEVDDGKRQLMSNMYDEAVKAVWQDFDDILTGKNKDAAVIESIRVQLQPLVGTPPPSPRK